MNIYNRAPMVYKDENNNELVVYGAFCQLLVKPEIFPWELIKKSSGGNVIFN